ncbi:MAG: replicative DNA helicase [Clostridia bacterium]|nr:replicative DNA helicase [Clostridia bacterium]
MQQDINASASLPNHDGAERSVLGAILQSAQALNVAAEMLESDDFYAPAHREIFAACMAVLGQGGAVDFITVNAELERKGLSEGTGGAEYLIALIRSVPAPAGVRAYANIVLEKSTFRKLIRAADRIREESYKQQAPLKEVVSQAQEAVFDIAMRRALGDRLTPIDALLDVAVNKMEEYTRLKGEYSGIPTGFADLDKLLTGLHGGELILIGARPSMGKTSLAMNICQYAAMMKRKKTAVFSLEMPREQIIMRMLCSQARVNMHNVRSGFLRQDDWKKIYDAMKMLKHVPLYIDDTGGIKPSQIRTRARKMSLTEGLDLIMVDYLQLMASDKRSENRQLEVSEISRQLKTIALELNVPVIACAQLNRSPEKRDGKKPVLSDLRDSGAIEQDADVVMFLHREDYYNKATENKNVAELSIAKQRNGPQGLVKLAWREEWLTFISLDRTGAPAQGVKEQDGYAGDYDG